MKLIVWLLSFFTMPFLAMLPKEHVSLFIPPLQQKLEDAIKVADLNLVKFLFEPYFGDNSEPNSYTAKMLLNRTPINLETLYQLAKRKKNEAYFSQCCTLGQSKHISFNISSILLSIINGYFHVFKPYKQKVFTPTDICGIITTSLLVIYSVDQTLTIVKNTKANHTHEKYAQITKLVKKVINNSK